MDRSSITSYYNMSTTNNNQNNAAGESYPYNGRVLLAAVILLSVVIFFVILLHIYARWFLRRRHTGLARVVSEPLRTLGSFPIFYDDQVAFFSKGLESKYIASLPMFVVDANYKEGDCVVCLSLMGEGEVGRRLPKCGHVFHVGCIDMWLMSNSTCPICRAQVKGAEEKGVVVVGDAAAVVVEVVEEEVVVVVGDEEVNNVVVELPLDSTRIVVKGDVSFPTSLSSSLSTPTATNTSTGSCSSSSSLKRVVSKSRSENRVFPSALVN